MDLDFLKDKETQSVIGLAITAVLTFVANSIRTWLNAKTEATNLEKAKQVAKTAVMSAEKWKEFLCKQGKPCPSFDELKNKAMEAARALGDIDTKKMGFLIEEALLELEMAKDSNKETEG